jgi:hypothetical protein
VEQYVGLDVSMEETSVCIIDKNGAVIFEGEVPSQPEAIAELLRQRAANAARVAFEAGALSSWLWHDLKASGFPVVCLDAPMPRQHYQCGSTRAIGTTPAAWPSSFAWAGIVKPGSKAWRAAISGLYAVC